MTSLFFCVAALAVGALHALEPGHGKTVVAAYLVGSRGKKIDAVILGFVVTLTHTFSIIILAIVAKVASAKWMLSDEVLHAYLGLAAGALILAVGLWMLVGRLRGREPLHFHSHDDAPSHVLSHTHTHGSLDTDGHSHDQSHDQVHSSHAHDHGERHSHGPSHTYSHGLLDGDRHPRAHGHDEDHGSHLHHDTHGDSHDHHPAHSHEHGHDVPGVDVEAEGKVSYWQLFLLGVSGGLVPCPAAMAVLLAGVAGGKVGQALTYVLLFSVGLAAALIAIGLAVVSASKFASRFLDAKRFAQKIGIVSAALITVIGLVTILGSAKHLIAVLFA